MKFLYFQFLKLHVWMLRQHLRSMGLRTAAEDANLPMLIRLSRDGLQEQRVTLAWIKVALGVAQLLSLWLIFLLVTLEMHPRTLPHSWTPHPTVHRVVERSISLRYRE